MRGRHVFFALTIGLAVCAAASGEPAAPASGSPALELPLSVRSSFVDGQASGVVRGRLEAPFAEVSAVLADLAQWCGFVTLHLNVKACTYRDEAGAQALSIYSGRKHYQPAKDAARLDFAFTVSEHSSDRLRILLTAAEGPLSTSGHRIEVEAQPTADGDTLLVFDYGYRVGRLGELALGAYLAHTGRDKVGFSTVEDEAGRPVLVGGVQGMAERNAVRYYLAIRAYLASPEIPPVERALDAAPQWFALTERYPRQLREVARDDYLAMKQREYAQQTDLQQGGGATAPGMARIYGR